METTDRSMPMQYQYESMIRALDEALNAHLAWGRRVFRSALTHTAPGADVLEPAAHEICQLGQWLQSHANLLQTINPHKAKALEAAHRRMHDAIRAIMEQELAGQTVPAAQMDAFEQAQDELIRLLTALKARLITDAIRHDPLTGLPLRYGLEHDFCEFQKACRRNQNAFYLAMIDVDHFKQVNDRLGHQVGDQALRHLARTLRKNIRGNEPIYRFGGEEFVVLLQTRGAEDVQHAAQRLLEAVRTALMPLPQKEPLALSVTIGLTQVQDDDDLSSALQRADQAMYAGKQAGRNRFVLWDAPPQPTLAQRTG